MNKYYINDVPFSLSNKKAISVMDEHGVEKGYITKSKLSNLEKGSVFSYTCTENQQSFILGIKKNGLKRFVLAEYELLFEQDSYYLSDNIGKNLLYFSVDGKWNDQDILFEENWSGDIELKVNKVHMATIKINDGIFKTVFEFSESLEESNIIFAATFLMYFMVKIYNEETAIIEELFF
ncbi:hypothetical protein F9U64_10015 [Gracilibacillus oryzae]|uniref:Uncharacterized protein n=1 Tax=Gracilibacillus oryzae TaxID=1672701 RepID=A0A7C8KYL8_9BACI|nr:hypothetical protein [Gracilibacillus oryzae]KAB8136825.1 hypothetical protein F9U64_10015 [Gracilibacillus oryzae]